MTTETQKWNEVLEAIRSRISQETFSTWFEHITFLGVIDGKVILEVPNSFFYEYLVEHFGQMLLAEANRVFLVSDVDIKLKDDNKQTTSYPTAEKLAEAKPVFNTHLDPAYTFDNFIKGDANKLARSIAMTIATKPLQTAFNPLFIYGDSGVGKSHLVNAIGLKMIELNPSKRVLYVSAHDFVIQYTDSVPKNKFNDFMYFYQSIDCLIVDDIHEISGKQKTQEALFNIFNHLQRNGRQIIFTSDKAPSMLQGFEERVSSRLVMGATAELQRPDEQLRRNILKAKIRKNQLNIPKDVIDYIATNVTDNVRDLEGVINSLLVQSIVNDTEITLEMTENVVSRLVRLKTKVITPELVVATVCKHYKITNKEINSASRKSNIVRARQTAMHLIQKHTNLSTTQIGLHIGRRDHTTVIHACRQADIRIKTMPSYKEEIHTIEREMTK
ncbi:MAG: chromosomal replication initiator protein DnaA [Bacteroidaceae bacterium]|nr:chromosomal replication initiator protein DnaA [Bacteroidaceae bacterium]